MKSIASSSKETIRRAPLCRLSCAPAGKSKSIASRASTLNLVIVERQPGACLHGRHVAAYTVGLRLRVLALRMAGLAALPVIDGIAATQRIVRIMACET